jgi:hypothetical protein
MGQLRRLAVIVPATLYLSVGASFAAALSAAIPAINWKGATYYALTWPLQLKWSPVRLPIPAWCFTFPETPAPAASSRASEIANSVAQPSPGNSSK